MGPSQPNVRRSMAAALAMTLGLAVAWPAIGVMSAEPALAQGWWPWSNNESTPRPREPMRPPANLPPPAAIPGSPPGFNQQGRALPPTGSGSGICLQLEQRLVSEGQRGNQSRELLPKLEADIRVADTAVRQAQTALDRGDCYDYFLFAKSLRQTPQCRRWAGEVEAGKRRVADLDSQRQQLLGSRERTYQDDIIRELARNGCGAQYVQEARKRDRDSSPFGSWSTSEDDTPQSKNNQFGSLPFATYRTVCVRLCDGYFFPVSFSTLPNHFQRDADTCNSRCAAPAELYYHQNPGADMKQATSVKSQQSYTSLRTAFRYQKEFVSGCSCKEAEYVPPAGDKKAEAPATGPAASGSQAFRAPAAPRQ